MSLRMPEPRACMRRQMAREIGIIGCDKHQTLQRMECTMADKSDKSPGPVREGIAVALMIAAVTATAASLLQQPLFLLGGFVLFLIFYIWRINPQIKAAAQAEMEQGQAKYADDDTYQPILDRFASDQNDNALIDAYNAWKLGPHENDVRLRFLQTAITDMIAAGKIYRIEELMDEAGRIAAAEGLTEQFEAFRANCDRGIAQVAQQRLASEDDPENAD